ncbi:hypothetical protein FRC01_002182 [Tulasnella sp. 417]|nr:hypothetical protein FRC01_002182 [Tulasnella sp. 417]
MDLYQKSKSRELLKMSDDEGPVAKLEAGGEKIASKTGEEGEAPSKKKKRRSSEAQEEETDKSRKKKKKRKD